MSLYRRLIRKYDNWGLQRSALANYLVSAHNPITLKYTNITTIQLPPDWLIYEIHCKNQPIKTIV